MTKGSEDGSTGKYQSAAVDCISLKKSTVTRSYPLPNINTLFTHAGGPQYFPTFDCLNATTKDKSRDQVRESKWERLAKEKAKENSCKS